MVQSAPAKCSRMLYQHGKSLKKRSRYEYFERMWTSRSFHPNCPLFEDHRSIRVAIFGDHYVAQLRPISYTNDVSRLPNPKRSSPQSNRSSQIKPLLKKRKSRKSAKRRRERQKRSVLLMKKPKHNNLKMRRSGWPKRRKSALLKRQKKDDSLKKHA